MICSKESQNWIFSEFHFTEVFDTPHFLNGPLSSRSLTISTVQREISSEYLNNATLAVWRRLCVSWSSDRGWMTLIFISSGLSYEDKYLNLKSAERRRSSKSTISWSPKYKKSTFDSKIGFKRDESATKTFALRLSRRYSPFDCLITKFF